MAEPGNEIVSLGSEIVRDPRVRQFMGRVVGEPASEAGAWLGDEIRYRRWKRQVKMLARAVEMLEAAGLDVAAVGPIDPTVLVPLIEAGSLQDNDDLAERWAALLANSSLEPDGVPPSYPEILRQLTAIEARLLDAVFSASYQDEINWRSTAVDASAVLSPEFGGEPLFRAVDNLLRLRLVVVAINSLDQVMQPVPTRVQLSDLGHHFVKACRPPARP